MINKRRDATGQSGLFLDRVLLKLRQQHVCCGAAACNVVLWNCMHGLLAMVALTNPSHFTCSPLISQGLERCQYPPPSLDHALKDWFAHGNSAHDAWTTKLQLLCYMLVDAGMVHPDAFTRYACVLVYIEDFLLMHVCCFLPMLYAIGIAEQVVLIDHSHPSYPYTPFLHTHTSLHTLSIHTHTHTHLYTHTHLFSTYSTGVLKLTGWQWQLCAGQCLLDHACAVNGQHTTEAKEAAAAIAAGVGNTCGDCG